MRSVRPSRSCSRPRLRSTPPTGIGPIVSHDRDQDGGAEARIIGDTNYYRHYNACADFTSATSLRPEGWRGRRDGTGYRRELYEDAIGEVLDQVRLGADSMSAVVGLVAAPPATPDSYTLARIERDRDDAMARYKRDRQSGQLDVTMARLDAEEVEARRPREIRGVPADVALRYLRELSTTWRKAEGGPGRRMLAEAVFERIEFLGFKEATLKLTDAAIAHVSGAAVAPRSAESPGAGAAWTLRGDKLGEADEDRAARTGRWALLTIGTAFFGGTRRQDDAGHPGGIGPRSSLRSRPARVMEVSVRAFRPGPVCLGHRRRERH